MTWRAEGDAAMQLILVRHGQTQGNMERRYVGHIDEPLCAEGREAGRHAAQKLQELFGDAVDDVKVYCSPLARAQQSALVLFPAIHPLSIGDFREMDFGLFEGKTYDEIMADGDLAPLYTAWLDAGSAACCPQGESYGQFVERTVRAFRRVVRDARDSATERLAIVAHGGTIMAIMSAFDDARGSYYDYQVKNWEGYSGEVCIDVDAIRITAATRI